MDIKANNWLSDYRKKIYSQNGEEGVLAKVFEVIEAAGQAPTHRDARWCVEFGAGRTNDNTRHFIDTQAWHGVLIESHVVFFADLAKRHHENRRVTCLQRLVHFEGRDALDTILRSTSIPDRFDLLVVDIDGNDIHVWNSLSLYQPKVVMIEYNGRIPLGIEFEQPKDTGLYWGSSLDSMVKTGKQKGYELVYAHVCNAIFVQKDLFPLFQIADNSPEQLVELSWPNTRWFQLHDGTIILHGTERKSMLSYKKKVSRDSIYLLADGGGLFPLRFKHDPRSVRFLKSLMRKTPIYRIVYPFIADMRKQAWHRKRKLL